MSYEKPMLREMGETDLESSSGTSAAVVWVAVGLAVVLVVAGGVYTTVAGNGWAAVNVAYALNVSTTVNTYAKNC